jgi:hypothetical protein
MRFPFLIKQNYLKEYFRRHIFILKLKKGATKKILI